MRTYDIIIAGGGPAGLSAALSASEAGARVLLIDRSPFLGGQLIKQTHKFFGSETHYAGMRGIDIAKRLVKDVSASSLVDVMDRTTVTGIYDDMVVTAYDNTDYHRFKTRSVIVATGASEKFLAFPGNDMPGVYGAGAIQTLMNVHGVRPGKKAVVVGSGNIGLIVSYQMIQAGIEVAMIVEAAQKIGGYKVHATKLRRLGIPIETSSTVVEAIGDDTLDHVRITRLDDLYNPIEGSDRLVEADILAIAVGLSPMHQLLDMAGARMTNVSLLGGRVPVLDDTYMTTVPGLYACGDCSGIEEASAAMMEGRLAGLHAARALGYVHPGFDDEITRYTTELDSLREGPFGNKTRKGLSIMKEARHV